MPPVIRIHTSLYIYSGYIDLVNDGRQRCAPGVEIAKITGIIVSSQSIYTNDGGSYELYDAK